MPITDAIHKADRLEEIKILFLRRPAGVGTREIAQLLRVSQRTARRYVLELSEKGRLPVYRGGPGLEASGGRTKSTCVVSS